MSVSIYGDETIVNRIKPQAGRRECDPDQLAWKRKNVWKSRLRI